MTQHYKVVIIWWHCWYYSGTQLLRQDKSLRGQIAIVDPATNHYYQPLWTLVGAGVSTLESTRKSMKQVLPKGVRWIKQAVQKFNPEENNLQLDNEEQVSYDYLVVCPGIQVNWSDIKGLKEISVKWRML